VPGNVLRAACARIILGLAALALVVAPVAVGPSILAAVRRPRLYVSFRAAANHTKIARAVPLTATTPSQPLRGCVTSCEGAKRDPGDFCKT